ncbi:muconolactone Delta-isomerase family protein [Streptomyces sp. TRM68367]|uniref:muconolactone Delta-isomerase n=1 Tax=Streptomyces sp. TRM68367 TaxID=2758415 RepID=UPI00165B8331|nr:muconolactone Delta-isomerase family protein [Streptomyces sp. TRM68367]MBC9725110.1 muconolactone delta-isomerase [Streptomyces sp. TRM68367]
MLFAVQMTVNLPPDMDPEVRVSTIAAEKEYAQRLQRAGEWLYLWRCAGRYSNLSIFDVTDNDRLNELLWGLPLFAYMEVTVTPLAHHPSAIG